MVILITFAFIAGIVTILSPCILPVLPIVLSGSLNTGKWRPLGIVAGFVLSFTFFTLFLSAVISKLGLSIQLLRGLSIVTVVSFGVALLIPKIQLWFEKFFSIFSRYFPTSLSKKVGFGGGFLIGLSLGLLWTPCVGPILASVISLAVSGNVNGLTFLITLAYSLGTSIPMLIIMWGGRSLLFKIPHLLTNLNRIQQGFGFLMILTGLAIFFNIDRKFQAWILGTFPEYGQGLTLFEDNQLVTQRLNDLFTSQNFGEKFSSKSSNFPVVPEFNSSSQWLNSQPLTFQNQLKDKVVLIDFWTYSCINCVRTFPYLKNWYDKYKDNGFVIVGVHSPEFEFEKSLDNLDRAVTEYDLRYPIVQDNDFSIWRAFNNRYWPAHYLVGKDGRIRYTHFGEGNYQETENKIRELLGEQLMPKETVIDPITSQRPLTPETYLGYARADAYPYEISIKKNLVATYGYRQPLESDLVGLTGQWLISQESIRSVENNVSLELNFLGKEVYLVVGSADDDPKSLEIILDDKPLDKKYWTKDFNDQGQLIVQAHDKYDLLNLGDDYGRHHLKIIFPAGVEAFAFTFGN